MDWSNERYVRLYVRDTLTWKLVGWEGRAVFPQLLRKVDRAGVFDLSGVPPAEAVAAMIDMPIEHATIGLRRLIDRGVLELGHDCLLVPNFIAAQDSSMSDKARQRESRERRLAEKRLVTIRESMLSQNVTVGHENGQNVTTPPPHVTPAVPSRAVPNQPTDQRPDLKIAPVKKTLWEQWLFDVILPIYPAHRRGAGLAEARTWVNDNQPDEALRAKIEASVREWSACPYWQREDGRFADGVGKFFIGEKWVGHPAQRTKPVKKFVG